MKKHNYVSFVRSFEIFAEKELTRSNNFFELSKFAISLNQRISELVKIANDEQVSEVSYLEGSLITTGMSFIKKFVVKNKDVRVAASKESFRDSLIKNLPGKF